VADLVAPLLGGPRDTDPAAWDAADPLVQAALRPELAVLLLHGTGDTLVPPEVSEEFVLALQDAGHDARLLFEPAVDHQGIYAADVAGPRIVDWLRTDR
jgi:dipeptidyl aminopeptidase/acylaminoacyl peptidase